MANLWNRLDYRNWFVPGVIINPCYPAMDSRIQCQTCVESCAHQAITRMWGTIIIDSNRCHYCGKCYANCPGDIIGIVGLDKLLVKLKRDREKGADTLYLFCDRHQTGNVMGAITVPTYNYLSSEVIFWAAALGYTRVVIPSEVKCKDCETDCYRKLVAMINQVNTWLQPWDKQLQILKPVSGEKPATQPISRRELFSGLGWNLKREVTELVVEELENRLTMVLPRTEQGYMRRQTLKAMAIKILAAVNANSELGQYPNIADQCKGCRVCSKQCPTRALIYQQEGLVIKPWLCNGCSFCVQACPQQYIELKTITDYEEYFQKKYYQFIEEG